MQLPFYVVFESSHRGPVSDRALVLQSQGVRSETIVNEGRYQLLVAEPDLAEARRELSAYQTENSGWQPRRTTIKLSSMNPWPGIAGYVTLMLLFAWAAGEGLGGLTWFNSGKVDAGLVSNGEWWRTITALTLHADLAHLTGNLFFGLLFGYFAGQFFGSGMAWLSILVSGAVGNGINSLLQSASHTSVGASTAIFGALGIVAAYSWKRKLYPQDRWAYRIGPVIGGIAMLAFTGTGGERTDIGAHLAGFVSGFGIGLLFAIWPNLISKRPLSQWLAGSISIAGLAVAWWLALG